MKGALLRRFERAVARDPEAPQSGERVLVALSGGVDSVVLLHLLRFGGLGYRVEAAHFDHDMRRTSASDARWVRGLCRAWAVPLHEGRTDEPLHSEEAARDARYAFLGDLRRRGALDWCLTAHHADDQAETVLFRIARGAGRFGLAGIAPHRGDGLWRPLLPFTRAEIEEYADSARLRWREDPTNRTGPSARAALRHRVLPLLESEVASGTRASLVELARQSRLDEEAWQSLMPRLIDGLDFEIDGTAHSVAVDALGQLHRGVQARVFREISARAGVRLGRDGTRRVLDFVGEGVSGARLDLGGGWTLAREFGRFVFRPPEEVGPERTVVIEDASEGEGTAIVGGRFYRVTWGSSPPAMSTGDALALYHPRYPLRIRGRRPGDRMSFAYGSKKVKKVLLEARVPEGDRDRVPLLVDRAEGVVWIPGVASAVQEQEGATGAVLHIGIAHADAD